MKKLVVASLALCMATSTFAWGDREQGALAGIAATLLYQNIQRNQQPVYPANQGGQFWYRPPVVQQQIIIQNSPVAPQVVCVPITHLDQYGNVIGHTYTCR